MATDVQRIPQREYTIIGVLGRGGFGTVYHARMTAEGGFVKDVAIKVLSDPDPPDDVLGRFRDEARILGMIRDRHIVWVDPPSQLDNRWAVVMEYVDGESCHALLRHGSFPTRVALEVVAEVSRTLKLLWSFEGPSGQPLHLLHRDLKPANLQITPNGDVKVLDFGVARARFHEREARTLTDFVGTPGYIAPERTLGDEGPYGDIYSLGVVLYLLLTREKPPPITNGPFEVPDGLTTLDTAAFRLAQRMLRVNPAERPTALEVAQQCDRLLREWSGPNLRDWAEKVVQKRPSMKDDELVGNVLQPIATQTRLIDERTQRRMAMVVVPVGTVIALLLGLVGLLLIAVGVLWMRPLAAAPVPTNVQRTPLPVPPPVPAPTIPTPTQVPVPIPIPIPIPTPATPTQPIPPAPVAPPTPSQPAQPEPPVVIEPGRVSASGAQRVELRGAGGTFAPGSVPAGTYQVMASFGADLVNVGSLTVRAGGSHDVRCVEAFKRCQLR